MRASAIVRSCIFPSSLPGVVPTQGSVAGEVDSRYALIAIERDAAPRVSECRPEIDEEIEDIDIDEDEDEEIDDDDELDELEDDEEEID